MTIGDKPGAEISERIAEARKYLDEGHDSKAAKTLEEIVYETHDHDLLVQIDELGKRGLEHSGFLHKTTWRDITKESEARLQRPEVV